MLQLWFQTNCLCNSPTPVHAAILRRVGEIRACVKATRPAFIRPSVDERLAAAPFVRRRIRRRPRILQTFSASACFVLLPLKLEKKNATKKTKRWTHIQRLPVNMLAEGLGCSSETYRQQAVLKIHIYIFWKCSFGDKEKDNALWLDH